MYCVKYRTTYILKNSNRKKLYCIKYRVTIIVGYNSPVLYAVYFFPIGTFNIHIVRGVKK